MTSNQMVGIAEIAELAGVSKQTVTNWRTRNSDFPIPIIELKSGPIWQVSEILAWAQERSIPMKQPVVEEENIAAAIQKPAQVVAMVNMKGGVGKSTLTANLGWYCAYKENKRVLLVDLDPQFNLSQYVLGSERYEELFIDGGKSTVIDIFERVTPYAVLGAKKPKLSSENVICSVKAWNDGSRIDLIASRLELAYTLNNPDAKEQLLAQFLKKVKKDYDLILIDCPPTPSMLSRAAFLASDHVLVPVKPEFLSTIGLPLLAQSMKQFQETHDDWSIQFAGILFNSATDYKVEHARSKSFVSKVAKEQGWYVFQNEVSYSDSYPAGARAGKPIFLTDYARYWKVGEFNRVAKEFIERIGL